MDILGRGLLLAPSASCFAGSSAIVEVSDAQATSFVLTNRGLQISLQRLSPPGDQSETLAILNCRYEDDFSHLIAIRLSDVGGTHVLDYQELDGHLWSKNRLTLVKMDDILARAPQEWLLSLPRAQLPTLIISREYPVSRLRPRNRNPKLWVKLDGICSAIAFYPREAWNPRTLVFTPEPTNSLTPLLDTTAICLTTVDAYVIITVVYDSSQFELSAERWKAWDDNCLMKACSDLTPRTRMDFGKGFLKAGLTVQVYKVELFGEVVLVLSIHSPAALETPDCTLPTYTLDNFLEWYRHDQPTPCTTRLTSRDVVSTSTELHVESSPGNSDLNDTSSIQRKLRHPERRRPRTPGVI
jgi:hypothetical protein